MSKKAIIISVIILIVIICGAIYFSLPKNQNIKMTQTTNQTPSPQPKGQATDIQGMKIEILKQGTGEGAKNGDLVSVNYTGTLTDGTKFDSSLNPGRTPFEFTLPGQVIQGWNLGLVGMKVGEERKLTIPPELAYGAQSPSPLIPPNSTLVFDITMLSINGK